MAAANSVDACPICKSGRFETRQEELSFLQWTDKGPLRCRIVVAVSVCGRCGYKTWNNETEAHIQEAVVQEYNNLP